jgi:hypothetical protein
MISRLADAGEDTLRELVALPRRILVGFVDRVEQRLHETAESLRGIDGLDRRVAELEKRVDSLEKPPTARRRPARPARAGRARAGTAAPVVPARADQEADRSGDVSAAEDASGESRPGVRPETEAEPSS